MILYLTFGLGFYIGMALQNPTSFTNADTASLLRGLILGVLAWPIGVMYQLYVVLDKMKK